jgi:predicted methyltransferase
MAWRGRRSKPWHGSPVGPIIGAMTNHLTTLPRALPRTVAALCAALVVAACGSAGPATPTPTLEAAVRDTTRGTAAQARDVYRHPRQTLHFFRIGPRDRVLEIEPGAGWYTDILAPYLRDQGTLYEAEYAGPSEASAAAERKTRAAFERKLDSAPARYGKVTVGTLSAGRFSGFDANADMDRVLTFRNIHNWIKDGQIDANLHAFYTALKPGGVLGVEEHRAAPGTPLPQMIATGYVTEAYVIDHARAAGFVLLGRSEINSNPRDTKDHPHGVWSLPPTFAGGELDKARYAAIGESDRMSLIFVKPDSPH